MSFLGSSRPYRASIDQATSGDRTIVAAVAGKQIVVLNYLMTTTTNTVIWKSGSTVISGAIDESHSVRDPDAGLIETAPGEALVLNLSSTAQVSGYLTYVLV